MPLAMNWEVFITCAVTGSGATQHRSPHVMRSSAEIATSAIEVAKAGVAAAVWAGGNVRAGLEDNLVEGLGARVLGPTEVRQRLGLQRAPAGRAA